MEQGETCVFEQRAQTHVFAHIVIYKHSDHSTFSFNHTFPRIRQMNMFLWGMGVVCATTGRDYKRMWNILRKSFALEKICKFETPTDQPLGLGATASDRIQSMRWQ